MLANMYRLKLTEQANFAVSHLVELNSDSSFRCDASHSALPIFLMNHRSTQAQTAINPTNDCQNSHQTAHSWGFCIGEVVFKHSLIQTQCRKISKSSSQGSISTYGTLSQHLLVD